MSAFLLEFHKALLVLLQLTVQLYLLQLKTLYLVPQGLYYVALLSDFGLHLLLLPGFAPVFSELDLERVYLLGVFGCELMVYLRTLLTYQVTFLLLQLRNLLMVLFLHF